MTAITDRSQTRRRSTGRFVWPFAGALALAVFVRSDAFAQAAVLACAFAAFAAWAVQTERRRAGTVGTASPLALYAVSWFAYFGIAGLAAIGPAGVNPHINFDPERVVAALGTALVSLGIIALSYRAFSGRTEHIDAPANTGASFRQEVLWVLLVVGWGARLYLFETGRAGYLGFGAQSATGLEARAVQLAGGLVNLALVALAVCAWSRHDIKGLSRRTAVQLLIANIPLLVITSLASGIKAQLVTDLVPVGVIYVMLRNQIPWRAITALALYLVLALSGIETLRADIANGALGANERSGLLQATRNASTRVVSGWRHGGPTAHVTAFWDHLTVEYSGIATNLAIILTQTPSHTPYLGTRRLVLAPAFFLPTRVTEGQSFSLTQYVNVVYLGSTKTSSAPPTQPGDFYLSGGWIAVLVGELAVGALLAAVWRFLVVQSQRPRHIVLYAVIAASFVNAGLDWASLSRTVLETIAAYVFVVNALLPDDGQRPNTLKHASPMSQ